MSVNCRMAELISVADVALRLGVHSTTVTRWCKGELLPHLRVGGVIRFDWSEVLATIQRGCTKTPVGADGVPGGEVGHD
jgi:excisionase family DNA binding protein